MIEKESEVDSNIKMPKKIKGLAPSLREKKRYLKIKIHVVDSTKLFVSKPMSLVISKLKEILGVFDSAQAGIVPVKHFFKSNTQVIRVSAKSVDKVKAALLFITEIGTQKVILQSLKVSGQVNKVMEE